MPPLDLNSDDEFDALEAIIAVGRKPTSENAVPIGLASAAQSKKRTRDDTSDPPEVTADKPFPAASHKKSRVDSANQSVTSSSDQEAAHAVAGSEPSEASPAARIRVTIPAWYRGLKKSIQRKKGASSTPDLKLGELRSHINASLNFDAPGRAKTLNKLIEAIHDAMFLDVTGQMVRDHKLLDEVGLQAVFCVAPSHADKFPFYTRADAEELWHKWADRNFSPDLMHGIRFNKDSAAAIKDNYPLRRQGDVFGNNDLVNGQWWPAQLCLVRDGAHKSSQGGIAGRTGEGAWSVLIGAGKTESGEQYPDHDDGETVLYCGTDGKEGAISEYTQRMLETFELKQSVRLIRSSKSVHEKYRPTAGFRYDGLYRIVNYEILDRGKQRHRFRLEREEGQDPIRFEGDGMRPTKQELAAWKKLHNEKKFMVSGL